jgi:hypothetical protein
MRRYIPEKIDIDKLINDCQDSHIKKFHPDKMKWLISEITEKPTTSSGFVEIHTKRFQGYIHNYKDYLEYLDATGIIERDLSFSHELVSKVRGYKFSYQYSPTIIGVEINYLPIVKKTAKEKEHKLKTCRDNTHLMRWLNPNLTVDYDETVDYLGTYNSELRKEQELLVEREQIISNTWYKDYSVKYLELQGCKTKNPNDSYKRAFISIDRIKEGEYHLSTDKTVSRFHSILTFMPSDFRNFLRYDGKE